MSPLLKMFQSDALEFQQDNLGVRSQAQRWSPCARAARGEHLHVPDPTQPVNKLPVNASRHPIPWHELPKMSVTRELQRNSRGFGYFRIIRSMSQQNAGASTI